MAKLITDLLNGQLQLLSSDLIVVSGDSQINYTNGLSRLDGNVRLGGILSQNTIIDDHKFQQDHFHNGLLSHCLWSERSV